MGAFEDYYAKHVDFAAPILEASAIRWEQLPSVMKDAGIPQWTLTAADSLSTAWNALPKETRDLVVARLQSGIDNLDLAGANLEGGGWIVEIAVLAIKLGILAQEMKLEIKGFKLVESYIRKQRAKIDFFRNSLGDSAGVLTVARLPHYWAYMPNPPRWRHRTVFATPSRPRDAWIWGARGVPNPTGRFPDGKQYRSEGKNPVSSKEKTPQGRMIFSALFWPWWTPNVGMAPISLMAEDQLRDHWGDELWQMGSRIVNPDPNEPLIARQTALLTSPQDNLQAPLEEVERVVDSVTRYVEASWSLGGIHKMDPTGYEIQRKADPGEFVFTEGFDLSTELQIDGGQKGGAGLPRAGMWRDEYGAWNGYKNTDVNEWGVKRFATMPEITCYSSSDHPAPVCSTSGSYTWINQRGVSFGQVSHVVRSKQAFLGSRLAFLEDPRVARYMLGLSKSQFVPDPGVASALEDRAQFPGLGKWSGDSRFSAGSLYSPVRPKRSSGGGLVLGAAAVAAFLALRGR